VGIIFVTGIDKTTFQTICGFFRMIRDHLSQYFWLGKVNLKKAGGRKQDVPI